jgi:hypothetical protein
MMMVFEDYYHHGFGNPCHPFLRVLVEYYKIIICNLHPNSILAISIFITLCESYLGILPHFHLFCHFCCLKKKGVVGGSRVTGGAYLNLRDGMREEYLLMPLSSSLMDWHQKWFYVRQQPGYEVACDVLRVSKAQDSWSA